MLSLSGIISIAVNLPSAAVQTEDFSLGLIVSQNTVISTSDRVKTYTSTDEMIAAGFAANSLEVAAAKLYFSAPNAPAQIAVGVHGATETALEAITACRAANTQWYACTVLGASKADIEAIAQYIESASPSSVHWYTTADTDVAAGTAGNVCLALQTAGYRRTFGQYSTETANAAASIMGYACGNASSSFTLNFKAEPGVTAEPLTSAQATSLDSANCSYYATRENAYTFFQKGVAANGTSFDEVLGIDKLTADIKSAMMSVLMSNQKVPQTDDGMQLITTAIAGACNKANARGFIAPGTWTGSTVLNLTSGTALTNGYSVQAPPISTLSDTDKANHKMPPIYVCVILAGSGESFTIAVNVER